MEPYTEVKSSDDTLHPLVPNPDLSDIEEEDSSNLRALYRPKNTRTRAVLIHGTFLALNLFICFSYISWFSPSRRCGFETLASTIQKAIPHEGHPFDISGVYNPDGSINQERPAYGGPPRVEQLDAWANLTQYMNIRLSPEELGEFEHDDQIIQLTDGSGAYGNLAVTHGIHCIGRIHRYLYQDYYYPDLTDHKFKLLKGHTEHCIDWLRQYIVCNADLTIIPMYWGVTQPLPMATDIGHHRCTNWDALQEWMKERTFDIYQPGLLMHPTFGSPYAKPLDNKLGIVVGEVLLKDGDEDHKDH